jgi:hypothetical protein
LKLWEEVYRGKFVIDDLNPEAQKPFAEALQSMNGGGIWRSPQDHG